MEKILSIKIEDFNEEKRQLNKTLENIKIKEQCVLLQKENIIKEKKTINDRLDHINVKINELNDKDKILDIRSLKSVAELELLDKKRTELIEQKRLQDNQYESYEKNKRDFFKRSDEIKHKLDIQQSDINKRLSELNNRKIELDNYEIELKNRAIEINEIKHNLQNHIVVVKSNHETEYLKSVMPSNYNSINKTDPDEKNCCCRCNIL
jgi:hypothetical protein